METRTLEKMVRQRNTQFTLWILIPVLLSYLILQTAYFVVDIHQTKKQLEQWKKENKARIARALFLKNEADLKSIVLESASKSEQSALNLQFDVFDARKRYLFSGGKEKPKKAEIVLTAEPKVNYWRGEILDGAPILLGDRIQGYLVVRAFYPWAKLFRPSLLLLLGCFAVFIILKVGVTLWVFTLNRSVVRPVEKLNTEISLKIEEISLLKPISLGEPEFRHAPQELLKLVGSYNRLIANIHVLIAKENQFVAGAAKFELASQVAHDIRSPLAALSLAIEELPPLPDNQRAIFLGVVNRINTIGEELLRDRKEEKSLNLVAQLVPVVTGILEEKRILFGKKPGVKVTVPDIPEVRVVADEGDLKRALSNLLDNAFEAVEEEGQISLKFTCTGGKLYLSVKDNGKGIPKEHFERIWEPGFSFDKKNGNGLGLSFVKSAVESWGGRVVVDSAVSKGTVISLQLTLLEKPI